MDAITVTWTEVPGADWYRVRYWTSGMAGWMDLVTRKPATETRSYPHTGLTPGTQYYYIVRGENSGGWGPYSGSPGNYDSYTLPATTDVPVLRSTHPSRTVVELNWTSAPAGSTYNLERRKVTTDSAEPPVSTPADNSGWGQLGGGNLSVTSLHRQRRQLYARYSMYNHTLYSQVRIPGAGDRQQRRRQRLVERGACDNPRSWRRTERADRSQRFGGQLQQHPGALERGHRR